MVSQYADKLDRLIEDLKGGRGVDQRKAVIKALKKGGVDAEEYLKDNYGWEDSDTEAYKEDMEVMKATIDFWSW